MKKLLVLLFSIFFLIASPSVFAETYFCVDDAGNPDILKRQGSEFSFKYAGSVSTLKIVHEDSQYLFLMGNFHGNGSTVYVINKISNASNAIWISANKEESSELYPGTCIKD